MQKNLPNDVRIEMYGSSYRFSATVRHRGESYAIIEAIRLLDPFIPEAEFVAPAAKDLSQAMDVIYNVIPLRVA